MFDSNKIIKAVREEAAKKMEAELRRRCSHVDCPEHGRQPLRNVRIRALSDGNFDLKAEGCCEQAIKVAWAELAKL